MFEYIKKFIKKSVLISYLYIRYRIFFIINKKISYKKNKNKIIILSTYQIAHPVNGGAVRIFNLYKHLSNYFQIEIISLSENRKGRVQIYKNMYETYIPITYSLYKKQRQIENLIGISAIDIAFLLYSDMVPHYRKTFNNYYTNDDIVIVEQPYCACIPINSNIQYIYSSHNYEYELKKNMINNDVYLDYVKYSENNAVNRAIFSIFISKENYKQLAITHNKSLIIKNGFNIKHKKSVKDRFLRQKNKKNIDIIFIGSYHTPNIEACKTIEYLADVKKYCIFHIIGSVCNYYKNKKISKNIVLHGVVSEKNKQNVIDNSDIALNPITSGSGVNLKISEYISNNIPCITTKFGIRGYNIKSKILIVSDINKFSEKIDDIINNNNINDDDINIISWEKQSKKIYNLLHYIKSN